MMKYIFLEYFKMKRRGIFLTVIGLLAAEVGWIFFALTRGMSRMEQLSMDPALPMWEYVMTMMLMLKSLIFPVMIAVAVSRVNDIEHKGNTWKLLESSAQTREAIWRVKFVSVYSMISLAQVMEMAALIMTRRRLHIAEPFPIDVFVKYVLGAMAVNAVLLLIQQGISMSVENQIISMSAGIGGAFAGFFSTFLPQPIRYILPWGYYNNLAPAAQVSGNLQEGKFPYEAVNVSAIPILTAAALAAIIYVLGSRRMAGLER